VPGITIDRNRGVGNGVTVRGLGPQFNTVTVNGRVIATVGAGREFDFSILPSELISGAEVYKSPQANINGASIGATINVKTLRPLDQEAGFCKAALRFTPISRSLVTDDASRRRIFHLEERCWPVWRFRRRHL
jgi:outer membrane receptor for ferrienterochelin and colicin